MEYYPRMMYHWTGRFLMCESAAHEKAMGDGWFRSAVEAQSFAASLVTALSEEPVTKAARVSKIH